MNSELWVRINIDISDYNPVQDILRWFHDRNLISHEHWFWDIHQSDFLDNKLCLCIRPDLVAEIFTVRIKWGS